jgi:hypothetical protein
MASTGQHPPGSDRPVLEYRSTPSPTECGRGERLAVRLIAGVFAAIFGIFGTQYVHDESWNENNYVKTAYAVVVVATLLMAWIAFRRPRIR